MSYGEDLKYYLRVAKRRFPYFIVPLVLVAVAGTGIVTYLPAIYSSNAKILVETQQIPEAFVKSTVTALATERIQVIQQRVKSRENLLRIVDKFDLFADRKGLSRTDVEDLMQDRVTFNILDLGPIGRRPRDSDGLTVAFSIGFDYESPEMAAKVANDLVTLVLDEDIQNRTGRAVETTSFLARETERLTGELTKIDAIISDFKLSYSNALPEKQSFNMSALEKTQRQVQDIERDLRTSEENKRLLQFEANIRKTQASAAVSGSPGGGQSIEDQLNTLKSDYAQRTAIYSESHPEMRAMRKLIAARQAAVDKAKQEAASAPPLAVDDPSLSVESRLIAQKIETIDGNIALLLKQREELNTSIDVLQKIILQTPQVGADLAALERKRDALQKSNDDMANKLSLAKLGERMEENQKAERFEVIEAPIVPQEPSRPKRLPLYFIVAAASLGMGSAAAFGVEFLDGTVKRSSDLTGKLNQRLLVVVPYMHTRREVRRHSAKILLWLAALLIAILLGLAAVHLFYSPLDILGLRMMGKLKSLIN